MSNLTKTVTFSGLYVLEAKVAKLNKRAKKLGLEPLEISVVSAPREVKTVNAEKRVVVKRVVDVSISGEIPKLPDYSFVGKVERVGNEEDELIHSVVDGSKLDPLTVTKGIACDHCKASRSRNKSFIVRSDNTGEEILVGSTCVKDFAGSTDFEYAFSVHDVVANTYMDDDDSDIEPRAFASKFHTPTNIAARVALGVILLYGFSPTSHEDSSSFALAWTLFGRTAGKDTAKALAAVEEKGDLFERVMNYWANVTETDSSSYMGKARSVITASAVKYEHFGILCAAVNTALKAFDREVIKAKNLADEAKAPKLEAGRKAILGTVLSLKWIENEFGSTLKMLVKTSEGNRIFGTIPASIRTITEVGSDVSFTATIEPKEDHFGFFSRPTKALITA